MPLRATRLLNRRFQNNNFNNNNNNNTSPLNGSESPRSLDSMHSRTSSARASLREHLKQRQQLNLQSQLEHSSTEDLLVDKSFRNSMLQDVASFKKQLVQLRRVLQEVSELCDFISIFFVHLLLILFSLLTLIILTFLYFFHLLYFYVPLQINYSIISCVSNFCC